MRVQRDQALHWGAVIRKRHSIACLLSVTVWEPPGNERVQDKVGLFISVGSTGLSEGEHPECRRFKNTLCLSTEAWVPLICTMASSLESLYSTDPRNPPSRSQGWAHFTDEHSKRQNSNIKSQSTESFSTGPAASHYSEQTTAPECRQSKGVC